MWEWNPEKRELRLQLPPAEHAGRWPSYLKLQGRFGHLHAEHIATLQKFANAAVADDGRRDSAGADLMPRTTVHAKGMAAAEQAAAIALQFDVDGGSRPGLHVCEERVRPP